MGDASKFTHMESCSSGVCFNTPICLIVDRHSVIIIIIIIIETNVTTRQDVNRCYLGNSKLMQGVQ